MRSAGRRIVLVAVAAATVATALPASSDALKPPRAGEESSMESAKRGPAPKVAPVDAGGVRYEVLLGTRASHGQEGGVVRAFEIRSGKELWTRRVYDTVYDANEEQDVQDVFIKSMVLDKSGEALLIENERGRRFRMNLSDCAVQAL